MTRFKKVNLLLLLLGGALFALLIYQVGPSALSVHLRTLGWRLPLLLPPYLFVYILDAVGWRYTLGEEASSLPFPRLFSIRMVGEAINYLTPMASLGGEPLKASLLKRHGIPFHRGLASVVLAKTIMTLAQLAFVILGLILALRPVGARGPFLTASTAAAAMGIPILTLLLLAQRRGLFTGLMKLIRTLNVRPPFLERREEGIRALDRDIASFYRHDKRAFAFSFTFFLAGWMMGSFEVYLLLSFLGMPIDLSTAFAVEALSTLTKAAGFFIPGSLGVLEGGHILIFLAFTLPVQAGMTFSLVKRGRELLWVGFGLLALAHHEITP